MTYSEISPVPGRNSLIQQVRFGMLRTRRSRAKPGGSRYFTGDELEVGKPGREPVVAGLAAGAGTGASGAIGKSGVEKSVVRCCAVPECTATKLLFVHNAWGYGVHLSNDCNYSVLLISKQLSLVSSAFQIFFPLFQGEDEMSLGLWGRLVVVGIGCSVVLFAVVIVVCFVHPWCWGFEYLEKLSDKKKKNVSGEVVKIENGIGKKQSAPKLGPLNWISKDNYVVYQTGNPGPEEKKSGKASIGQSDEKQINLKCAPFFVNPVAEDKEKTSGATLKVKLSFTRLNGDNTMGRLAVLLLEANSLPYREYFTSLEPYVVLEVLSSKWSLHKNERTVQTVQSRIVRHTFNPKFDQNFLFDVKRSEIKDLCLKFTLFDEDRLTRRTPICEKRIYVREVKNLMTEPDVLLVTDLHEIDRNQGELLFGISYLPTAQRLSISVIKASCLKFLSVAQSIKDFNPYVRVLMLNSQGKCVKKKKTSYKVAEENPVFNETLVFDLPISHLEHAVFLLVLCSKILGKQSGSDGSVTDPETEHPPKENKDNVLGVIVVGRNVKSSKARDHWLMVMQNPRKIISVWHRLK